MYYFKFKGNTMWYDFDVHELDTLGEGEWVSSYLIHNLASNIDYIQKKSY